MNNKQHAAPSMLTGSIIIFLTVFQVALSGVVVYFVVNEISYGRGPAGLMLFFMLATVAAVDLFLIYWVVQLIESWAEHEA